MEHVHKENILIIEDDETIKQLLCSIVTKNGYPTDSASDGNTGLEMALHKKYDLILMDLMLPEKSGEDILRQLRRENATPVIVLSAKNAIHNKIELLRLGADDYITKPFDIDEVILRIQAVLRRTCAQENNELSFREITINTNAKRIFINGNEITCTRTEYAILELLMMNPSKIFSKRNLFESVMGTDYLSDDNTMNVHISNLRKKIAGYSDEKYIETVYGMGYRLSS